MCRVWLLNEDYESGGPAGKVGFGRRARLQIPGLASRFIGIKHR